MWIGLACFVVTRNFHLTLLLHNAIAAVGFTGEQYRKLPPGAPASAGLDPALYRQGATIGMLIVTFAVPYLLLHVLEWQHWPEPRPGAGPVEPA
jgi:hypothetical protein